MSHQDDGGPAFPTPTEEFANGQVLWGQDGMRLRDYFAAAALSGRPTGGSSPAQPKYIATSAYELADAMLEARKDDRKPATAEELEL